MNINELSPHEQKLYDFIKISKEDVTIKIIEEKLGKKYVGCLGKLLGKKMIKKDKKKKETIVNKSGFGNPYSVKYIKFYSIEKTI